MFCACVTKPSHRKMDPTVFASAEQVVCQCLLDLLFLTESKLKSNSLSWSIACAFPLLLVACYNKALALLAGPSICVSVMAIRMGCNRIVLK